MRGHLPFGEVPDHVARLIGYDGGVSKNDESALDAQSELANGWFEPREISKGNVARSIFYVRAIYSGYIERSPENIQFFEKMRRTLRTWHKLDPPSTREIKRTHDIERIQGNCNPFVLKPEYVDELFFSDE